MAAVIYTKFEIDKINRTFTAVPGVRYEDVDGNKYVGTTLKNLFFLQNISDALLLGDIALTQNYIIVGNALNLATGVSMSGDATIVSSGAFTLNTVNLTVGTFGAASKSLTITTNGKGLITAISEQAIAITKSQVSDFAHDILSASHSDTLAAAVVRGDLITGNATPKWSRLAIGANGTVLASNGTDASWQVSALVVPAALTKVDDTNVTVTLGGTPATSLLQAVSLTLGWTGTLGVARGGTNIASYAVGDIIYASGATTLSKLADVATGSVLSSGGVGVAPSWQTLAAAGIVSGTGVAGQVTFWTGVSTIGGSTGFLYSSTNKHMAVGAGISAPTATRIARFEEVFTTTGSIGVSSSVDTQSSAAAFDVISGKFEAFYEGVAAGSANFVIGVDGEATQFSTQTVTDLICFRTRASAAINNGNVTNVISFYARVPTLTGGGTYSNIYGLKIDDLTAGTNRYPIYQAGVTVAGVQNNILAANTRIGGLTNPTNALSVTGNTDISGTTIGSSYASFGSNALLSATIGINVDHIPTELAASSHFGSNIKLQRSGATTNSTFAGLDVEVFSSDINFAGTYRGIRGVITWSVTSATLTIPSARALIGELNLQNNDDPLGSLVTITQATGLDLSVATFSPPAVMSVTNYTGILLPTSLAASIVTGVSLQSASAATMRHTGSVRIGSTVAPTVALDVTGAAKISTTLVVTTSITSSNLTSGRVIFAGIAGILSDDADMTFATDTLTVTKIIGSTSILSPSPSGGIGYSTGAGGTVTQITSKSTSVTINTICGQITMQGAALAAATNVTFTVNNTSCATTDVPCVAVDSGGTANAYSAKVVAVGANSFAIMVKNETAGSLSEAPVISFAIIKAVTA